MHADSCSAGHELTGDNVYTSGGRRRCRTCQRKWNRESYARRRRREFCEAQAFRDSLRLVQALIQRNAALEGRWIPDEETALLIERMKGDLR